VIECAYRQYRARCRYSSLCALAWEEYERSMNPTTPVPAVTQQYQIAVSGGGGVIVKDPSQEDEGYEYEEIDPVMLEAASWVRHGRKLQLTDLLGGGFEPDVNTPRTMMCLFFMFVCNCMLNLKRYQSSYLSLSHTHSPSINNFTY
jgi:hypothetical protein